MNSLILNFDVLRYNWLDSSTLISLMLLTSTPPTQPLSDPLLPLLNSDPLRQWHFLRKRWPDPQQRMPLLLAEQRTSNANAAVI